MTRWITAALLALMTVAATAGEPLDTSKSIRMGDLLVRVGDSEAKVLAAAKRAPDREVTLENRYGGAVGQRWIYIEPGYSGRVVTIEFYDGKVDRLWSERLQ